MNNFRIAIIGGGISGAWLSSRLTRYGASVTVFEKSRGAGGRMSSRRAESIRLDHGAQFIEAQSEKFREFLFQLEDREIVKEWKDYKLVTYDSLEKRITGNIFPEQDKIYVAVPGMNQIAKHLLFRSDFINKTKVSSVSRGLELFSEEVPLGKFDLVISTAPSVQSGDIFSKFPIARYFSSIKMKAHFAALIISDKDHEFDFDGANLTNSILNWIGINSNKPGKSKPPVSIVLHTNFEYVAHSKSLSREDILNEMLTELKSVTGFEDNKPRYLDLHRWFYGRTLKPLGEDYIWDEEHNIAVCGDWLLGDNIEAAWTSADRLADQIINKYYK
jgi:predicted NAD/FAD-dependent oxidoreductase